MSLAPRDILIFSTADWDHPFWTNKQHTAQRLARRDHRVLYVESLGLRRPSTSARDLRRMGRRLRRGLRLLRPANNGIQIHSPLVIPAHDRPWLQPLNQAALRLRLAQARRRLGFGRYILWTYNPLVVDLVPALRPALTVYHCVDDLSAAPDMPAQQIRDSERRLVAAADLTFTTSHALQDRLHPLAPGRVHYFSNVVDEAHFAHARQAGPLPADLQKIPKPRLGFIGALSSYKVDFELIRSVAQSHPDWHWVLIGQVGEGQPGTHAEALEQPNVHLLGPRPYAVLPDYLRGFDVATLPMRRNDYTEAMFPMKFFEYLAAGRPVVSVDLPAIAEFGQACWWRPASGFAQALSEALAQHKHNPGPGIELAQKHTWERRLDRMLALVDQAWNRRHGDGAGGHQVR